MTTVASPDETTTSQPGLSAGRALVSQRANALATRLEQGAARFAALAGKHAHGSGVALARPEGRPQDRRPRAPRRDDVSAFEIQLAQLLAGGNPIEGVTWEVVHAMNFRHVAAEHDAVTKEAALDLLQRQQRGGRRGDPCPQ